MAVEARTRITMDAPDEYYGQSRPEILPFIPLSTQSLIDIGCGEGRFGEAVKRRLPGCEVWGVEPVASAAAVAAQRNDKILARPIEDIADLPTHYFDVVTMNDVLEHLPCSEPVLKTIIRIVKPNGRLVLSLPNVRFYLNVRDLLFRGDWHYQDFGVLDRTHLRFFTQKSAARLLAENGFAVTEMVGINAPPLKLHYRMLFTLAPRAFSDMVYPQFVVVSSPGH